MSSHPRRLRPLDLALALAIVAVWGTNFVVIKIGLDDFPPFFFALLRFAFCAIPLVFFVRRPAVEWRWLILYGVFLGAGQFGVLFYAMRSDISPGLASVVLQLQVFFTIGLSVWLFREKISAVTVPGALLAAAGLAVIAFHLDASVSAFGIAAVSGAALCWACANVSVKQAMLRSEKGFDMFAFIVWASLFAVPPLLLLTLALEGWRSAWQSVASAHLGAWLALAWQVVGNMLFGFVAWNRLLTRYDAATITPYALLLPVFGLGSSALVLGEPLPAWKLAASAMVLGGIAIITLAGVSRKEI